MRTTTAAKCLLAAAVAVFALGACGDDEETKPQGPTTTLGAAGATVTVTAFDIGFRDKKLTAPAGVIEVKYKNEGSVHDLHFEDQHDFMLEVKRKGDSDSGKIQLEAGEYTFYCSIPGHRGGGMEGTLTVS